MHVSSSISRGHVAHASSDLTTDCNGTTCAPALGPVALDIEGLAPGMLALAADTKAESPFLPGPLCWIFSVNLAHRLPHPSISHSSFSADTPAIPLLVHRVLITLAWVSRFQTARRQCDQNPKPSAEPRRNEVQGHHKRLEQPSLWTDGLHA